MLPELQERDATGEIAAIYEEIRRFCGVPYVSSMQRHLATRPGCLEWVWAALRPAFAGGRAQTAAWRTAGSLEAPPLAPIARDALRVWGVDAAGEATIRGVCESFVRISPTNLMLSGMLRRLLGGERPAGPGGPVPAWTPPAPLAPLPALVDVAALPPAERGVLLSLGARAGDHTFVPGLYRMLAHWPGFLAHVATVLRPLLDDAASRSARRQLLAAIDAEVPAVLAELPALPGHPPPPPAADVTGVLQALDGYRKTSPEMVVFGLLIRDALPAA